jgi:hypothetical protein
MPDDKNILIQKVELKLYKYANAYHDDVEVSLRNNLDNNENKLLVDNGDYDFDELLFDVTDTFKSAYGKEIQFYLKVTDPDYKEGIAVCSGSTADSLCQTKYFPKLEISYVYNTKGQLEQFSFDETVRFNANYNSENVECAKSQGCKYKILLNYKDKENNAILNLTVKSSKEEWVIEKKLNSQDQEILLDLEDGNYSLSYGIVDGAYTMSKDFTTLQIDTTPPKTPVVLNHSQFGARSGIYIDLLDQEEGGVTYEVKIFADQEATEFIDLAETSDLNFKVTSKKPLENEKRYYYQIVAIDDFDNRSKGARFSAVQKNNLLELKSVELSEYKISPKNKDKKFDQTALFYKSDEKILKKKIVIKNSMFKDVFTISKDTLIFDGFDGKRFLDDGVYYLQLVAFDQYGYQIADHKRLKLIIDNTSPRLL